MVISANTILTDLQIGTIVSSTCHQIIRLSDHHFTGLIFVSDVICIGFSLSCLIAHVPIPKLDETVRR
jgi:hypothetical protein